MTKQTNVPKLRFPEFSGSWEVKKLGELCKVQTGNKDTQNRIENGKYPFFVRSNTVEKINSFSFNGEAILTSGDGVGVGKNFHYINGKFDYHQRVYCLNSFEKDVYGKYIYFVFSEKFGERVLKLSAKNSVDSVRRDMITLMEINLPPLPEQTKIANFLTAIDEKIQGLKEKKSLLEEYKKGLMQQIFSQKLRFKQDDGSDFPDWEEKTLGEVSDRIVTKNKEGNTNVLTISAQLGLISQLEFFNKSVSAKDVTGYYLLEKEDFAYNKSYSNGYPMGAIKRLKRYDKGVVSTLYICFRFKENINLEFMDQYFESGVHNQEIEKVAQEGARNHGLLNIGLGDFFNTSFKLPSTSEQDKIANFLSSIDEKIEKVSRQIAEAENYKKGLLQQMFV